MENTAIIVELGIRLRLLAGVYSALCAASTRSSQAIEIVCLHRLEDRDRGRPVGGVQFAGAIVVGEGLLEPFHRMVGLAAAG
jgi:hypothetical protein